MAEPPLARFHSERGLEVKQSIFIVRGDNGESYSDHDDWDVAAYTTREMAELHAELANEFIKSKKLGPYEQARNPYDGGNTVMLNYSYGVFEIPLVRHVDEFLEEYPAPNPDPPVRPPPAPAWSTIVNGAVAKYVQDEAKRTETIGKILKEEKSNEPA